MVGEVVFELSRLFKSLVSPIITILKFILLSGVENREIWFWKLHKSKIMLIVDYITGAESMWLTSAELEEGSEAERLNCTS